MKKTILRWLMRVAVLLIILCVPFGALGGFGLLSSNAADAVSSATPAIGDPNAVSGEYVVYINRDLHSDTLDIWTDFFKGESIPVVLDDISCMICSNDEGAKEFAELCQSRLPENQMKISSVNPLLLLSKGDNAKFDIIILSKEVAENYHAETIQNNPSITAVYVV